MGADREYAILTAEISKAAFGMTPSEYKKFKGLTRENLRSAKPQLRELRELKIPKDFHKTNRRQKREELSLEMPGKNWKREAAKKFPQNRIISKISRAPNF